MLTPAQNIPPVFPQTQSTVADNNFWGPAGFTFKSVLDIINPLQQIPVVSDIYRAVSGDTIATGSRLAGGALLGGPIGFVAALINSIVEDETGKDIGGNMLAMLGGEEETQLASAANATPDYSSYPEFINTSRRASYNAYVQASQLA
jgi:hypothetical protein